jgi:tRNA dimethylallyltransferase
VNGARQVQSGGVLVIAGPSASGKSRLAMAVAAAFNGVIINADSMQLYRELRILTARPSLADEAAVPHRLYGVLPAAQACSAAAWRELALAEIGAAESAGKLPIVVGGTGLYVRALLRGLAAVPPIPPAAHAEARALHDRLGAEGFHRLLAERDPAMAARLPPGDRQRLLRAYTVVTATGKSLAHWQGAEAGTPAFDRPYLGLRLEASRDWICARCDARLERMMAEGALDEVRRLMALNLDPELPAMKALGVRELARHLRGEGTLEDAMAATRLATRRYVKRQMTWMRNQVEQNFIAVNSLEMELNSNISNKIFPLIQNKLLTA